MATRFFSPPDSWYGSAVDARSTMSSIARVSSTRADDRVGLEAHVERAERELFSNRGREHLRVGVLEDEPDPAAEGARELLVLEVILGDLDTERRERPAVGERPARRGP